MDVQRRQRAGRLAQRKSFISKFAMILKLLHWKDQLESLFSFAPELRLLLSRSLPVCVTVCSMNNYYATSLHGITDGNLCDCDWLKVISSDAPGVESLCLSIS
jgi:hypothetical protein